MLPQVSQSPVIATGTTQLEMPHIEGDHAAQATSARDLVLKAAAKAPSLSQAAEEIRITFQKAGLNPERFITSLSIYNNEQVVHQRGATLGAEKLDAVGGQSATIEDPTSRLARGFVKETAPQPASSVEDEALLEQLSYRAGSEKPAQKNLISRSSNPSITERASASLNNPSGASSTVETTNRQSFSLIKIEGNKAFAAFIGQRLAEIGQSSANSGSIVSFDPKDSKIVRDKNTPLDLLGSRSFDFTEERQLAPA